ncbi:MAG: hypothetical protein ACRDSF_15530 [Pseudonocardiaceae bacterium]
MGHIRMKWGLSVLDFCSHAIDDRADHPCGGVYSAECGHLLMRRTTLHEQPYGPGCATPAP